MKADLHVHSTASDGTVTPADLVRMAVDAGVAVLAIADHDSVEGLPQAIQAAEKTDVTLVPAVELSAVRGDLDLHVLGYFVDHEDSALLGELALMRKARLDRASAMVAALKGAGYGVEVADVLRFSREGAVGRSHIARALVGAGAVASVRSAFEQLIGRGRPFYVPKSVKSPSEAIRTIHSAGGVAVLAHPGVSGLEDELIVSLRAEGLDGIEAYHADHSEAQRTHYAAMAAGHGMLATGGTDYHGPDAPNPPLGRVDVPEADVQALLAAGSGRR